MSNVTYSQHIYDPATKSWATVVAGSSYNDLSDQPVRNAVGSSPEAFVNIAGLNYGRYILRGYYKYDSTFEVDNTEVPLDLLVVPDDQGRKVVTFPTIEAGVYVTNIVTYENGVVVSHTKQAPGVNYWKPF